MAQAKDSERPTHELMKELADCAADPATKAREKELAAELERRGAIKHRPLN